MQIKPAPGKADARAYAFCPNAREPCFNNCLGCPGIKHHGKLDPLFAPPSPITPRALQALLEITSHFVMRDDKGFRNRRSRTPVNGDPCRPTLTNRAAKIRRRNRHRGGSRGTQAERRSVILRRKWHRDIQRFCHTAHRLSKGRKSPKRRRHLGSHTVASQIVQDRADCNAAFVCDHFKAERRHAVAKIGQLHIFEHDISQTAIGRRAPTSFRSGDQRIDRLIISTVMQPKLGLSLEIPGRAAQ